MKQWADYVAGAVIGLGVMGLVIERLVQRYGFKRDD